MTPEPFAGRSRDWGRAPSSWSVSRVDSANCPVAAAERSCTPGNHPSGAGLRGASWSSSKVFLPCCLETLDGIELGNRLGRHFPTDPRLSGTRLSHASRQLEMTGRQPRLTGNDGFAVVPCVTRCSVREKSRRPVQGGGMRLAHPAAEVDVCASSNLRCRSSARPAPC